MSDRTLGSETGAALLDGRIVSLRRLAANDADGVRRLHQRLNGQDCYFRFFTTHPAHLDELVHQLTEPEDRQTAIGAFDNGRLIGVASFAARDDPNVADVAVVVADGEHLHGVGTALLRQLVQVARSQGIRRFVADVLSVNHLMLKVVSDAGWPSRRTHYGPVVHLEIELSEIG